MIGKCCLAAALLVAGAAAAQTSTTLNVPIIVTHGAPLTTFTFVNNSGNTLPAGSPISFGQAFRYGDVMPGNYPVIRNATTHVALAEQQWDEISTWRENGGNGSWRHAVWVADLPNALANGASYQVEFVATAEAYSKSPVLALSALCSGVNTHDLKIHLSDVRNQDDTVRQSGDATFRLCDHITVTGGRDDPRILDAGPVRTMAKIVGTFVYTNGSVDPLLYAECNVGLYVDPATGNSLKDTSWVCWIHNSWMTVAASTAGHAGNPGPVGLPNDPQALSYRPEMLDGSASVLNWSGLDATVTSASNPVTTNGCGNFKYNDGSNAGALAACLTVPSSTGVNAWYYGQATRVTSTGTPVGGLPNGGLTWVFNAASSNSNGVTTNLIAFMTQPCSDNATPILTASQGSGTTSFSYRVWHPARLDWLMMDPSLAENWSPGGTATRVTREVLPAFLSAEKTYWEETGIVTPIDFVDQSAASFKTVNYGIGGDNNYHAFARGSVIGGQAPGARPDLGFPNDYAVQAFIRGTPADWLTAKLFSVNAATYPYGSLLDEASGRIPVLNNGPPIGPGGNGIWNSNPSNPPPYAGLGIPRTTYQQYGPAQDFANPLENVPSAGTNWETGPWPNITFGAMDHEPNFQGFTYAILGSRHWLDLLYFQGNRSYSNQYVNQGTGSRNDNLGGPNMYWGLDLICCQTRGSARGIWDKTLPAALGGDNNIERTYFNDIITENGNYYPQFVAWKDGPSNHNLENSLISANWPGSGYSVDTFIMNYVFAASYAMQTYLHAPMAANWLPTYQIFMEGFCGEQMANRPPSYYCMDYTFIPAIKDLDLDISGPAIGASQINGTDAGDFWSFASFWNNNVLPGGQLQLAGGSYILTPGDQIKWANGITGYRGLLIDQLPGNTSHSIMGPIDNNAHTYYVQCTSADHIAFPTQCPVAGQAFTGFTRNGVPVVENADGIAYRPQYDPGPGGGFADPNYAAYGKMILNGLQILGYDVSHAQPLTDARQGATPTGPGSAVWNYEQYQWWDPTIVVPK